jgi:hypothetical protein
LTYFLASFIKAGVQISFILIALSLLLLLYIVTAYPLSLNVTVSASKVPVPLMVGVTVVAAGAGVLAAGAGVALAVALGTPGIVGLVAGAGGVAAAGVVAAACNSLPILVLKIPAVRILFFGADGMGLFSSSIFFLASFQVFSMVVFSIGIDKVSAKFQITPLKKSASPASPVLGLHTVIVCSHRS